MASFGFTNSGRHLARLPGGVLSMASRSDSRASGVKVPMGGWSSMNSSVMVVACCQRVGCAAPVVLRRLTAAQSPRPARLARKSVNFICVIQREKLDGLARLTARKGGTNGKFFR